MTCARDLLMTLTKPWNEWNDGPPIPYVEKELLSKKKGGLVLDLGCGSCRGMARFRAYGWDTVGIDVIISPQRLMGVGDVVKASGLFLPFKDGIFDVIILAQVLHHIPQPHLLLSEVSRCLKRNGFVLIGENIEDNYFIRLGRLLFPSHDGMENISDYSRFRKDGLKDLIQDSGFEIHKEATGTILWVAWYELAKRLKVLRPLSFFVKEIDNRLEKAFPDSHAQYYCLCSKKGLL